MSRGGFYRGTNIEQDARFKNKEKLILDNKKFPKEFDFKVDIGKVKDYLIQVELKVIRQWVEKRINEILGFEDEFLNNYIITLLEDKTEQLDPKKIQHLLTGFLNQDAAIFMKDLWNLLISAQTSPNGIPAEILQEKEDELKKLSETKAEKLKFLEKILGDKKPADEKRSHTTEDRVIKDKIKEIEKTSYRDERKEKHRKRKRSSSSSSSSSSSYSKSRSRSRSHLHRKRKEKSSHRSKHDKKEYRDNLKSKAKEAINNKTHKVNLNI